MFFLNKLIFAFLFSTLLIIIYGICTMGWEYFKEVWEDLENR